MAVLSLAYVTEESDDPSDSKYIMLNNIFCFTCKTIFIVELNDFMQVLDARVAKKKQQPPGLTARKVLKEGKPSECLLPPYAPVWAVKNTGQFSNTCRYRLRTSSLISWSMKPCFSY